VYQTVTTTKHVKAASSPYVLNVMAQAASPVGERLSVAETDCSDTTEQTAENADGDFFFCAASGTVMAPIFRTALSQAQKGIKLLKPWQG
jgi:hypothetical protein